jgi:hypothetical protein
LQYQQTLVVVNALLIVFIVLGTARRQLCLPLWIRVSQRWAHGKGRGGKTATMAWGGELKRYRFCALRCHLEVRIYRLDQRSIPSLSSKKNRAPSPGLGLISPNGDV